jgi:hypothetical protein
MERLRWKKRFILVVAVALVAGGMSSSLEAQTKAAPTARKPTALTPKAGDDSQFFRSPAFGFRFSIPYGWVDRTQAMKEGNPAGAGEVLLAVFERPPDASADSVNSAVVIASESAASYPGLKKAEDYVGPLTELATARGLKPEGEAYALDVESRQLVRADFSKALNDKLVMRQCTLILLAKGQIVSFTFIAGGEEELDNLMDGLHFGPASGRAR